MSGDLIRLSCPIQLQAAADKGKPRRLQILAYTGGEMQIDGFGPLVIALDGLEHPATVPILSEHKNELGSIIATGKPAIDKGTLTVSAIVHETPAGQQAIALLEGGAELQASIGAQPTARKYIAAGESVQVNGKTVKAGDRGLLLIQKSQLKEVSVLPIGADGNTSVALAARKGNHMSDTITADPAQDVQAARRSERERLSKIEASYAEFAGDLPDIFQAEARQIKARAVEENLTIEGMESALAKLSLRAVKLNNIEARAPRGPDIRAGGRNWATTGDHLAAALMVRCGYGQTAEKEFGAQVMEQSKRLHRASLPDLCRAALQIDRRDEPEGRDAMIKAALSTGSLPVALGNTMNKVVVAAYTQAPATWRSFAKVNSAANFKTQTSIRPTFATGLEEVGPGGEVKHGSYAEETYTWNVDTFARQIQIPRKSFINDDVSVFAEIIPAMGRAAARAVTDLVYSTLLTGASAFWTSGRANYITGSTTTLLADGVGLQLGLTALRRMVDAEGNYLDLTPFCLLVPTTLERTGRELIASAAIQRGSSDAGPTGNVYQNIAQLEIEPRLSDTAYTGYSATAWYLFSRPENAAVVVGFLDGIEAPTIETFDPSSDINTLAYGTRCVFDFGTALGDYRASIRSKGAA